MELAQGQGLAEVSIKIFLIITVPNGVQVKFDFLFTPDAFRVLKIDKTDTEKYKLTVTI